MHDTTLPSGLLVPYSATAMFRSLAHLAQMVGELEYHGEDATPLRICLDAVEALQELLPFEVGMSAAAQLFTYIEVAFDHAATVPTCTRCQGPLVNALDNYSHSGLNADLSTFLQSIF